MGLFRPRWLTCLTLLLLTLSVAPMFAPAALAQDTAASTPSTNPLYENLVQAILNELPDYPALVRLVRITMQPGSSVPLHSLSGPEFVTVESGVLTVLVQGDAVIAQRGTGGTTLPPRVPPVGQEFDLVAGDQIVYPTGVTFSRANRSQDPVTFISAIIVPVGPAAPPSSVWADGTPSPDAMSGVNSEILGDAVAPGWPDPPFGIFIQRLILAPGEPIPAADGPVMLAIEHGQFGFQIVDGEFQVSRGASGPMDITTPGASYIVGKGDAVFFPGGMGEVPRTENDGVLLVVRVLIRNASDLLGDPNNEVPPDISDTAAPTPAAGDSTTQTQPQAEQPADTTGGTGNATINETGVRIRDTPSVSGAVVAQLDTGRAIVVTGEPVEGDGINWYPIQVADDPGVTGFIAEGFFDSAP